MATAAISSHWLLSLTRLMAPRTGWFVLSKPHTQAPPSAARPSARVIRLAPPPKPGDAQRFSTAMMPHLDDAYTFARYLTRGDAASEEYRPRCLNSRALRAYPGFRGGDGKAWIFSIVRNCFLTWAKSRSRGRMVSDDAAIEGATDERTPASLLDEQDTSTTMRRLIDALPAPLSEVIVLREIDELSYRDIAETLDIPIGTVMSRLARAREQLAKAWRERRRSMTDCKEHEPLLHGLLDGELDAANALKAEQHIATCKSCAERYAELVALRGAIRGANLKQKAPEALRSRVRSSIERQSKPLAIARRFSWPVAGLVAASLFAFAVLPRTPDIGMEVASSHVRSMQANHIVDVASDDHHTVKPWFAGHLDFAPPIYDIAAQGYPLVGGRVDYVNGHTVAAVVYRHNGHFINLFIWPKRDGANGPALPETRQGYNVLHWTKLGFSCWAVSDMSSQELQRFEALVKDQTPV